MEKLHQKLGEMAFRIQQLENALRNEIEKHATVSSDTDADGNLQKMTHPLLTEELLEVKTGFGFSESVAERSTHELEEEESIETAEITSGLGVLAISDGGAVQFLGSSGSEVRMICSCGNAIS